MIVGFGPGGKRIAESLLEKEEKIAVIDTNDRNFTPEFNDRMESFVGDATDRDILVRAGMMAARQVIITVPEAAVAENITRKARQLNMHANIIVRSKYASEVEELEKLGADLVIPEELTVADMINRSLLPGSN